MADLIDRKTAIETVRKCAVKEVTPAYMLIDKSEVMTDLMRLPSAQPNFDITVKIDKVYDDGYETGYLQGRHDWGDLDE